MELREQYARLLSPQGVSNQALSQAERDLGVRLPNGVRRVAHFFDGDLLGGISHKAWDPADPDDIVSPLFAYERPLACPHNSLC